MTFLFWLIIFVVSLAVLVKSSDYFTDSAEKIGIFLKIPPFIVGVTIIAIGTSLPELATSIAAVLKKSSEIVPGNVFGSNITNILLVLGVAAVVSKKVLKTSWELVHVDLPLLIGSAFLLGITCLDGKFSLGEAIVCVLGFIIYLWYTATIQKEDKSKQKESAEIKEERDKKLGWKPPMILIASAFFIYLGAKYSIEAVINLSEILKIGTEIIAASAVALGTSLPELFVSVVAARKGQSEIAIGNVLGSNIFNSFLVMGVPGILKTLVVPHSLVVFALPVMIGVSILYFFITQDKEVTKWEGWFLIVLYILFIGKLFGFI